MKKNGHLKAVAAPAPTDKVSLADSEVKDLQEKLATIRRIRANIQVAAEKHAFMFMEIQSACAQVHGLEQQLSGRVAEIVKAHGFKDSDKYASWDFNADEKRISLNR